MWSRMLGGFGGLGAIWCIGSAWRGVGRFVLGRESGGMDMAEERGGRQLRMERHEEEDGVNQEGAEY